MLGMLCIGGVDRHRDWTVSIELSVRQQASEKVVVESGLLVVYVQGINGVRTGFDAG